MLSVLRLKDGGSYEERIEGEGFQHLARKHVCKRLTQEIEAYWHG